MAIQLKKGQKIDLTKMQDKARNVGFDWEEKEQVWEKVKEEIAEFQVEIAHMDKDKAEAEFGDVMFSLINAARLYKIKIGRASCRERVFRAV